MKIKGKALIRELDSFIDRKISLIVGDITFSYGKLEKAENFTSDINKVFYRVNSTLIEISSEREYTFNKIESVPQCEEKDFGIYIYIN